MKFKMNGNECRIEFERGYVPRGRYTFCDIKNSRGESLATSSSVCHKNDTFVKEIGRKKALKTAIKSLDRATRTIIWTAYNNRKVK